MANPVTLFCQVAEADLPEPGKWVGVTMSNGMVAQLWNIKDGSQPSELSHSLRYVPVATVSPKAQVIHAAICRRVRSRNRVAETTICSRMGDDRRIVSSIVTGSLDEKVTCHQCRTQLAEDGAIPNA